VVMIDGWPYRVPVQAIIHTVQNQFGRAVVCYSYTSFGPPMAPGVKRTEPQDAAEILCFVPPNTPS
jgi:hypothetical protein